MSTPSWTDLEALFHEALARAPADRAAFLTERCAGRPDLQAEVEALLRAHEGASGSWEMPSVASQTRLKAGARVGPYEVLAELGAGGMGEVYRAHDMKLGRDVAIKVLPKLFTSDAERLARFEREARVLAALNHPNIAVIHGIEDAEGAPALVLELIDGVTLAERLARPLPVTEALTIARQIADALEAAHEKGIIHRDLKPANIKITSAGVVKVLDFGLAKVSARDGTGPDLSQSPTVTVGGTREGMILGTAAYMSPEQARGQAVDRRTDIWAFGCVLYEMLAGRRAFRGETVSETLAEVMKSEPLWTALPPETPATIRTLLRRCLEKDPRRRVPEIAVARFEMEEMLSRSGEAGIVLPTAATRTSRRAIGLVAGTVLIVGALVTGTAGWLRVRPTPPRVVRFAVTPPATASLTLNGLDSDLAIAPHGGHLVYVGAEGGQLVVRALDQLDGTSVGGLDRPRSPFFSPDGKWIGFFDGDSALKKVPITGGPSVTICGIPGTQRRGASWGAEDIIIFATNAPTSGLMRVRADGGEPEVLTTPDRQRGEANHAFPHILPGGQAVLFTIQSLGSSDVGGGGGQLAVLDLRTGERKVLVRGGSDARYVATGHLVYNVAGTLQAVGFDLARLEVTGAPVPVVEQVMGTTNGPADFSISDDGTLVYVPRGTTPELARTLVWVDRQGREAPIKAPPRGYVYPRLSPDGNRLALTVGEEEEGGRNIWIWDLTRETLRRFTFAFNDHAVWTPDGRRFAFRSFRGQLGVFWQAADGTGSIEQLVGGSPLVPESFSPDGTRLLFRENNPKTGQDIWMLPLDARPRAQPPSADLGEPGRRSTSEVRPLVQSTFNELNAEISPDGRWVAYQSNESGRPEVYVRPFPNVNTGRWQISTDRGMRPLWARSGRELFYLTPTGGVMSVAVEGDSGFTAGTPTKLFEGRYYDYAQTSGSPARTYDVSPDGQRFLMIKVADASDKTSTPTSIVVVEHWFEELKRLVPTN